MDIIENVIYQSKLGLTIYSWKLQRVTEKDLEKGFFFGQKPKNDERMYNFYLLKTLNNTYNTLSPGQSLTINLEHCIIKLKQLSDRNVRKFG